MLSNNDDICKDTISIPDVRGSGIVDTEPACVVPLSKACSPVTTYHCTFMEKIKKDWFRLKKYPHIGLPLKTRHREWVEDYISNVDNISRHAFYPFIHKKLSVRKFRRKKFDDGTKSKERVAHYKPREIFYANHLDSMIFGYYSELLMKEYEQHLKKANLSDCVTAYRSIPLNNIDGCRNKCNIDFANDVFNYIKSNKHRKLVAITFDITSFFDNLNHRRLKSLWCKMLNVERLPSHHYNVFKNLTQFSYIEFDEIFESLQREILVEKNGKIRPAYIPRQELLKEKNAVAFCHLKDFDKKIRQRNLIKSNKIDFAAGSVRNKGIPQGSPISATLANIYLLNFDTLINEHILKLGGLYKRYSDDMVVIVDEVFKDEIYHLLIEKIKDFDLDIQPSKTQIFYFKEFKGEYKCKEFNLYTEGLSTNTKFDYLGFSFDGTNVYLKSSGLSKYYRKMKRSIKRGGFYAKYGKNQVPKLFKNRLYKRFTIVGAHRRMIVRRVPNLPNTYIRTGEYDWGNFLTYAILAAGVFPNNKINHQIRNHWRKFHQLVKLKEIEIISHYDKKDI